MAARAMEWKFPSQVAYNKRCAKPILIDTGEMHEPYDWAVSSLVL